ncbi:hypothetical protein PR001_g7088 [Phytophthora rubi]|uniref:DDE-1 domain-containing protein n=1 Tax=Phytophthora rubi TaxID=129364 RepID=A0A6A3NEB1_9STRA|nr:hypothetical protein PR001_g7088 [Phytophthora rubi]
MENHNIVLRVQSGKRQLSAEKIADIEKQVASHLGELQRGFESGIYDENTMENIDETHFVVDFDNGKTLGFGGENKVKYADVVSGGDGMTMVVRISGGPSAHLLPPMMIFSNDARSYPIRGVSDDVDDECTEELEKLNASLKFFPPNATDLCQPADSFVIAKIKDEWRRLWNEKKIELIEGNAWQNKVRSDGAWSGKLKNPGKIYFLTLAAKAVRRVNAQRDKNGLNYARKAKIRCGLSLDVDGKWRVEQLFFHLQEIIRKYPDEFTGKHVGSASLSGEGDASTRPPSTSTSSITEAVV